ncbi:MAG TPA: YqaJ viral recombinase family protein, partial [Polyangiaceae bacterium]|nr:YqaJ viral recombinase family protein [Polyangiaceae bacterium]
SADRTHEVTAFHEHAEWTGVTDSERDAWLTERATMVTASDAAAIIGEDEHRSALEVYVDKIMARREPEQLTLSDPRFWGKLLERPILEGVAQYHGWTFRAGGALLRSRKHSWLGATLDAEIDRGTGVGWEDFEGKTTRVPKGWNEEDGSLPNRVLVQVQAQLLVTGAPSAVVFALLQGSRPCQIEVDPSPEFHAFIAEATEEFIQRVRGMNPPDPDGSASSTRALARLFPHEDGSIVQLAAEAADWTQEVQKIAEQLKVLEARRDELRNMLRKAIGPSSFGLLPGVIGEKSCWSWRTNKVGSRVLTPLKRLPEGGGKVHKALPEPNLEELLKASVENENALEPVRFTTKRRRARR